MKHKTLIIIAALVILLVNFHGTQAKPNLALGECYGSKLPDGFGFGGIMFCLLPYTNQQGQNQKGFLQFNMISTKPSSEERFFGSFICMENPDDKSFYMCPLSHDEFRGKNWLTFDQAIYFKRFENKAIISFEDAKSLKLESNNGNIWNYSGKDQLALPRTQ